MDESNHDEASAGVRAAALAELEGMREVCQRTDGGCSVFQAIALCAVLDVAMPGWLGAEFVRRRARVTGAEVLTWDEAFGSFWPLWTRLSDERRNILLRNRVHAAVWTLIGQEPDRAINRGLFNEVGKMQGIHLSGAAADRRYYEALAAGALNVNNWRCTHIQPSRAYRAKRSKGEDAEQGFRA